MGLYSFTPQNTGQVNRDFSQVKPDELIYCYDNFTAGQTHGHLPSNTPGGILLVSMPAENALKVEKQGAAGTACKISAPWSFTPNATTFER